MIALTLENAVGEFVSARPANSKIFERLGIDYCCGGKKPLAEACQQKGLDPDEVLSVLNTVATERAEPEGDPAQMTLTELADHIEQTHHAHLREELPRIEWLVEKVARVHGDSHPWLHELRTVHHALRSELQAHMLKEEEILFPIIRRIEAGTPVPPAMRAGLAAPINCMEAEHASAGQALETMRRLSGDYRAPEGACNSFRAMLDAMAELESDLHLHIHKENNILFPRALALSRRQAATPGV